MEGVENLAPDTYKVPKERIANEKDARLVVSTLQEAEKVRSQKRAKLQGMLDGNPPYPPGKLRDVGQGHRTNLNLREGEGMVDAAKTPYYDLVFEVPQFAQVYCEYGGNGQQNIDCGKVMGQRYHEMLDDWPAMDFNFQLHQWQMCVHGVGPLCWRDARDWQSEAVKAGQFLVPDDAPANIRKLETAVMQRSMMPGDLYHEIEDESAAKTAGWQVEACKQAIVDAAPDDPSRLHNFEYYQQQIRAGDVTFNAKAKRIFIVDLFQKEFDGKVSHYIMLDTESVKRDAYGKPKGNGFLFKKIDRFECFDYIICPFFYDVGTGDWHTVKGLGPRIYDYCNTSNILTCDMIDGARVGSGITLQAADSNALQTTQIVHIGGAVVIQPGYTATQTRIAENLQGPLAVKRDLQQTLQSNTGQYRQRVSEDNQEPTLGQAQLNARQQAVLGKGAVNRYYKALDAWHKETLRRAIAMGKKLFKTNKDKLPGDYPDSLTDSEEGALRFYQRCVQDGVPEEALDMDYICSVKATRAVGYGSPQMQEIVANGLMSLMPFVDEESRNNILRAKAAQLAGQGNIDAYVKPYQQAGVPDDQVWAATMENNALREMGGDVVITPSQDDAIHFGTHYQDLQQHTQELQNGQSDPMKLLIHVEQAGMHMNQHLSRMAGDPTRKNQVNQMRQVIVGLSKLSDQLKKQIQQAMQAQAEANSPPPQPDPDLVKVEGDLQLKAQKNQGDMALKAQKQAQQMRLKDLQAAHNMKLKTVTAQANANMDAAAVLQKANQDRLSAIAQAMAGQSAQPQESATQ